MPRGGGGGGSKHGRTEQHHPPATGSRDEGALSLPTPSLPAIAPVASQKKKQRQPAAVSLPEGPLIEILPRLPYRLLCRFRCVSKQWLSLCSDTNIVKRAPQTLAGFFHSHDGDLHFSNLSGGGTPLVDPPSFPFLWCSRYHSLQLDQCSSGLVLCKCWGLEEEEDEDDKGEYVVFNPITRQWTTLPPILCQDGEDDDPEYYELVDPFLGFDPAVPSRFVVLARLVESVDHVAVFSSETGQWTRISGWEYRRWYRCCCRMRLPEWHDAFYAFLAP
ncbi:hypothetical protein VPH35_012615 [Triticum aestivum]